jgi:hypothetical protein
LEQRVLSLITGRLLPKLEQKQRQLLIAKGTQVCTLPSPPATITCSGSVLVDNVVGS